MQGPLLTESREAIVLPKGEECSKSDYIRRLYVAYLEKVCVCAPISSRPGLCYLLRPQWDLLSNGLFTNTILDG